MKKGIALLWQCLLAGCILSFSALAADSESAPSAGELVPVEAFSSLPEYDSPHLSPNGKRIAYETNLANQGLTVLMTLDLETGNTYFLLRGDNEKVKINWFHWANDEDLVISARYESKYRHQRFYQTRSFVMAYNDQGKQPKDLIDWRALRRYGDQSHTPQFQDEVIDWLPDDPEHILMAIDISSPNQPSVFKVNVKTRKVERIERGKRGIRDWLTDQNGEIRIGSALNYDNGDRKIYHRSPDDEYELIFEYNAMTDSPTFAVGFGADPNLLYYKKYVNDHKALFTLNLKTKEHNLVYADPDYDVDGALIYSPVTRDAIGIRHVNAPGGRYYWDERYKRLQTSLDKIFEDKHNILVSFSADEKRYIFYTENDKTPGKFYIGDRDDGSLMKLFDQYSAIPPDMLNGHELRKYTTRDGLEIEEYITLPKFGKAPYPTIVHPHGGPGARNYSGFDYWTAYFVSRGYAVIRPNFRGSSGYGYSFSQAQMKGWGEAMQDDITDSTLWGIKEGLIDPEHVCIVGASYGGYAALMAAVKTPDLFKCAVSFAGVSDLEQLVSRSRYFLNSKFVKNQIGDDDDDLERRSPASYAKQVKIPILLVHGDEDRIVHVEQSRIMAEELEDEGKNYRYVELEAGDHYLSIQRNRHLFFKELDSFLNANL